MIIRETHNCVVLYRLRSSITDTGSWIFISVLASCQRLQHENLFSLQGSAQPKLGRRPGWQD